METFRRGLLLCLSCGIAVLAFAGLGAAATFNVTSLADSGPGSLREAVLAANTASGSDQIFFAPGLSGTITLTSGEIAITDHLVITGPGADVLTVSGNDQSRIFHIDDGTAGILNVTLFGLTLTQGFAQGPGGAVLGGAENITIRNSVLSDSVSEGSISGTPTLTSACGGNIAVFDFTRGFSGFLRIEDSTLVGGVAKAANVEPFSWGGNLCAYGVLERSTVSGGSADSGSGLFGGGLIRASTISGNNQGAAVYGSWNLEGSTVSGNAGGGVIIEFSGGTLNSTISGNA